MGTEGESSEMNRIAGARRVKRHGATRRRHVSAQAVRSAQQARVEEGTRGQQRQESDPEGSSHRGTEGT